MVQRVIKFKEYADAWRWARNGEWELEPNGATGVEGVVTEGPTADGGYAQVVWNDESYTAVCWEGRRADLAVVIRCYRLITYKTNRPNDSQYDLHHADSCEQALGWYRHRAE